MKSRSRRIANCSGSLRKLVGDNKISKVILSEKRKMREGGLEDSLGCTHFQQELCVGIRHKKFDLFFWLPRRRG